MTKALQTVKDTVNAQFVDVLQKLDEIAEENKKLVFDYETKEGEKAARSQIFKLKRINGAIDNKHKEIKAPVLEQYNMIDQVKRDLKTRVAEMIAVHQKPLDEIKEREFQRQKEIEAALREITKVPEYLNMRTSHAQALAQLDNLLAIEVTKEVFQERYDEAVETYDRVLGEVEQSVRTIKENEERDRELADLRKKQAEQDRKDREIDAAANESQRMTEIVFNAAAKAKKEIDTEKLRLLTMFADWIVEEYAISDATGDQLIEQFFAKHPNVR